LTSAGTPAVSASTRPTRGGWRLPITWLGAAPFFVYVGLFLVLPTLILAAGSFANKDGSLTLSNFSSINQPFIVKSFVNSAVISTVSALVGAMAGALLAYAIAAGNPQGLLRRVVVSAAGVLAQFGGVTLAFAFLASIGPAGIVYVLAKQHGFNFYAPPAGFWIYDLRGLQLVYLYFQIPLMVLVFLPAVDGIKPQWREAAESLGGNTWHYWRYVAGPLLAPAFLGCTLLLFANSFSAYATANALINQGGIILPQQIANAISSEVGLHEPGFAKAMAVTMIVIVVLVTVLYSLLQRRTSKWLQ